MLVWIFYWNSKVICFQKPFIWATDQVSKLRTTWDWHFTSGCWGVLYLVARKVLMDIPFFKSFIVGSKTFPLSPRSSLYLQLLLRLGGDRTGQGGTSCLRCYIYANCPRPAPLTTNNPYRGSMMGQWDIFSKLAYIPQKNGTSTKCSSQGDFAQWAIFWVETAPFGVISTQ